MKPRILLVNPWIHDFAAFNLWARPLGLLKVAECLSAFDVELLYIDCTGAYAPRAHGVGKYRSEIIGKPDPLRAVPRHYKRYGMSVWDFRAELQDSLPFDAVFMTSIMTYWYTGVQETISVLREVSGNAPIVLGGIYPTLHPDHALKNTGADKVYAGPAGRGIVRLLQELGLSPHRVRDPAPYHALGFRFCEVFAPLLTSTGCPYRCSYCAAGILSPMYEKRSVADVLEEIQALYARGVRDFAFYDDALLYQADVHIKPMLDAVLRSGLDVRLHAPNGLHARFIDRELAALMKTSGFTTIRLSLETIDAARQQGSGGKVSTLEFEHAIRHLEHAGFTRDRIGAYLLYGLPGQRLEEAQHGVEFLKALGVRIQLAEFSPIRGTASWEDLVRRGVIPDDLDPLFCNNTVFSRLYSGYDWNAVARMKLAVREHNERR